MSCKILLLVVVVVLVVVIATGGCVMFLTNIFGGKDHGGEDAMMNATESIPDYEDEIMSSESVAILPTDGDEMIDVDGLFPDSMRDDLKLELILKALELLKTSKKDEVHRMLPRHGEMTEELKFKLILKAILLLKDKKLTSHFAGHLVADLKLTLLLKAIHILQDVKTVIVLDVDLKELELSLILKALQILKVYKGHFIDTVFDTKTNTQLKLKLVLLGVSLLKSHDRHARDVTPDVWPINVENSRHYSQSEHRGDVVDSRPTKKHHHHHRKHSHSKPTVRVRIDNGGLVPVTPPEPTQPTVRVRIDNGGLIPVTSPEPTPEIGREIPGSKGTLVKFFKWLKVLHKKAH
ncbi:uncharacterized protein LOC117298779 [Asterias rubens]|uniref:uncharacterized protein LOC117298779 n=1 Tax=Asterias rubens TaxID=7604 RepID=UPI001455A132|nr:uncharacterized protein LOC117298779 [Asterias rubens]